MSAGSRPSSLIFFFSSRRRHTRSLCDWSSDVCSSDLTLYRSSDGGNTWSEVPALDGTSVFDIEFAPDGTAYLGTQDSVWKSTDGGLTWAALNLGIEIGRRRVGKERRSGGATYR